MGFLLLIIFLMTGSRCNSMQDTAYFTIIDDLYQTVGPMGMSFTASSYQQCSLICLQDDNCKCFLFDGKESKCILGATIVTNPDARGADTRLYCSQLPTTTVRPSTTPAPVIKSATIDGMNISLYISNASVDRETASQNCGKMSGYLVSIKSRNKLTYLMSILMNPVWIGLSFKEPVFPWDNGGELLDIYIFNPPIFFGYMHATNYPCFTFNPSARGIYEHFCNASFSYVCEY